MLDPINGAWSVWSPWGDCANCTSCNGVKTRYRTCNNPPPKNNGKICLGHSEEEKDCPTICKYNILTFCKALLSI